MYERDVKILKFTTSAKKTIIQTSKQQQKQRQELRQRRKNLNQIRPNLISSIEQLYELYTFVPQSVQKLNPKITSKRKDGYKTNIYSMQIPNYRKQETRQETQHYRYRINPKMKRRVSTPATNANTLDGVITASTTSVYYEMQSNALKRSEKSSSVPPTSKASLSEKLFASPDKDSAPTQNTSAIRASQETSQNSPLIEDTNENRNETATRNNAKRSIGVNLRVTGQCNQGGRKYMEDFFSVAYQQSDNAKDLEYAFIGIYDGHGGSEAATFAKEHLMMEIINQKLFWSDSDEDVLRAIREGYIATHFAMWRDQENWPRTANGLLSTAGTTATVAFIRREKIYIGHVGDSGIVLGYQDESDDKWQAKQLTTDHKPESLVERARITNSGGKVVVKSGVPRVVWNRPRNVNHKGPIRYNTPVDEIPFLAVARSLGDLWSYNFRHKEFVVSPDPDLKVIKINPKTFRCLIFGTDGLWNVVTPQEAVDSVFEREIINARFESQSEGEDDKGSTWMNPSKGLVEKALGTWSARKMRADNTSVVTVILYPPTEDTDMQPFDKDQLHAEISTYPDPVTYKELAEKHLPPTQYCNYNYYEDEIMNYDMPDYENNAHPVSIHINRVEGGYWQNIDSSYDRTYISDNESWSWQNSKSKIFTNKNEDKIDDGDDEEESEDHIVDDGVDNHDNDVEEENDDDDDDDDDEAEEEMEEIECSVINYSNFIRSESATNSILTEASPQNIITENDSNYMDSFAESYNSLLSEQIPENPTTSTTTTNSNSAPYHSINESNMEDIIQEQQLYQEQCMSEEDGYSLTKLETRLEQQRCSNDVQTFKIYQQCDHNKETKNVEVGCSLVENFSAAVAALDSESPAGGLHFWDPISPTVSTSFSHYDNYQSTILSTTIDVKIANQSSQNDRSSITEQEQPQQQKDIELEYVEVEISQAQRIDSPPMNIFDDGSLVEEYLDEEITKNRTSPNMYMTDACEERTSNSVSSVSSPVSHISTSDKPMLQQLSISGMDDTIGNYSISANNAFPIANEIDDHLNSAGQESTTQIPITKAVIESEVKNEDIRTQTFELPKVILNHKLSKNSKRKRLHSSSSNVSFSVTPTKRSKTMFLNITKENQRHTTLISTPNPPKLLNRRLNGPAFTSTPNTCNTANNGPKGQTTNRNSISIEKRQLRSSNHIDFSKRTLRSRNTLAKDLKSKSALTTASVGSNSSGSLKRSTTSLTNQLLCSSLLEQKSTPISPMPPKHVNNNNSSSISNNSNNNNSINTSNINPEKIILNGTSTINLRSRQISPYVQKPNLQLNATNRSTTSTVGLRRERRSLRNLSATTKSNVTNKRGVGNTTNPNGLLRSSSSSSPPPPPPPPSVVTSSISFGKSTRLQSSVGSILAPPPPSPKLINAVAVVAAATRARSLLTSKNTVRSVFEKRTSSRNTNSNAGNVNINNKLPTNLTKDGTFNGTITRSSRLTTSTTLTATNTRKINYRK